MTSLDELILDRVFQPVVDRYALSLERIASILFIGELVAFAMFGASSFLRDLSINNCLLLLMCIGATYLLSIRRTRMIKEIRDAEDLFRLRGGRNKLRVIWKVRRCISLFFACIAIPSVWSLVEVNFMATLFFFLSCLFEGAGEYVGSCDAPSGIAQTQKAQPQGV